MPIAWRFNNKTHKINKQLRSKNNLFSISHHEPQGKLQSGHEDEYLRRSIIYNYYFNSCRGFLKSNTMILGNSSDELVDSHARCEKIWLKFDSLIFLQIQFFSIVLLLTYFCLNFKIQTYKSFTQSLTKWIRWDLNSQIPCFEVLWKMPLASAKSHD